MNHKNVLMPFFSLRKHTYPFKKKSAKKRSLFSFDNPQSSNQAHGADAPQLLGRENLVQKEAAVSTVDYRLLVRIF